MNWRTQVLQLWRNCPINWGAYKPRMKCEQSKSTWAWRSQGVKPALPAVSVGFISIPAWRQNTNISRKLNCLEVCKGLEKEENSHIPTLGHFSTKQNRFLMARESVRNRIQSWASKPPRPSTQGVNVLSLSLPIPHDLGCRKSWFPAVCGMSSPLPKSQTLPGSCLFAGSTSMLPQLRPAAQQRWPWSHSLFQSWGAKMGLWSPQALERT